MTEHFLRIDPRFRGPPTSGNGGYVAGLLARELGDRECVVTLRRPPPLARDLAVERDGAAVRLVDGEEVVAFAAPAPVAVDVPPPPALAAAIAAQARFTGHDHHIFPGCFVCGPERVAGDGLRIFTGRLDTGTGQVAAAWTPDDSLHDPSGALCPEFIWAALDCPGYFAVQDRSGPAVLGRLGVTRLRPIPAHAPLIVTGWPIASDGRKHQVGTALHDDQGRLLAAGLATWVSLHG